jgi:alanine racemase
MAVVKANAYGHGAVRIAQRLQELGTDYFAVAYTSEGVELRNNGITTPILVLHPQIYDLELCIKHCLEPVIYGDEVLEAFIAFAKAEHTTDYPIHLEFNTGMNRLGLEPDDLEKFVEIIKNQTVVKVRAVHSHLGASEDQELNDYTNSQISKFAKVAQELQEKLGYKIIKHEANTSGILNHKSSHFNMVRSGIGLYGYGNDPEFNRQLKPISSLKAQISLVKTIEAGESISYNRSFMATQRTTYAVIPLGHGDGINRIHGYGKMKVIINGELAPSLGIICMDMFMVNVTGINCKVGDEVTIFNDSDHDAYNVAENAETISYELLTGISDRVQRIYLEN